MNQSTLTSVKILDNSQNAMEERFGCSRTINDSSEINSTVFLQLMTQRSDDCCNSKRLSRQITLYLDQMNFLFFIIAAFFCLLLSTR
jgi:hypothetical protein